MMELRKYMMKRTMKRGSSFGVYKSPKSKPLSKKAAATGLKAANNLKARKPGKKLFL